MKFLKFIHHVHLFLATLYSILNVLEDVISVKKQDVKESISLLMATKKKISSD